MMKVRMMLVTKMMKKKKRRKKMMTMRVKGARIGIQALEGGEKALMEKETVWRLMMRRLQ